MNIGLVAAHVAAAGDPVDAQVFDSDGPDVTFAGSPALEAPSPLGTGAGASFPAHGFGDDFTSFSAVCLSKARDTVGMGAVTGEGGTGVEH